MMKIIMGCDHGGFELKETLKKVLIEKGYEVEDYGIHKQERVDYPDYAQKVGEAIASGKGDQGILICGTGIGMSIAANKVKGVRAALCNDCQTAQQCQCALHGGPRSGAGPCPGNHGSLSQCFLPWQLS